MGQQRDVDVAVPGRDSLVEAANEQVRVGTAIDEQASAVRGLEEDGVTLAHVEHAHGEGWTRSGHERDGGHREEG